MARFLIAPPERCAYHTRSWLTLVSDDHATFLQGSTKVFKMPRGGGGGAGEGTLQRMQTTVGPEALLCMLPEPYTCFRYEEIPINPFRACVCLWALILRMTCTASRGTHKSRSLRSHVQATWCWWIGILVDGKSVIPCLASLATIRPLLWLLARTMQHGPWRIVGVHSDGVSYSDKAGRGGSDSI